MKTRGSERGSGAKPCPRLRPRGRARRDNRGDPCGGGHAHRRSDALMEEKGVRKVDPTAYLAVS
ncbi:hypothetical protein HMPREF9440_02150 [Sutterella parvirubra YIT 11816]|uniref:Uncharacterized protein n=1 Tax=Sutterella parvirubra YIT 11816 TaxID=762967 RepID=H3KHA7_9BURK|nr:hypothetical protein HMPREF9440_02150 [Sutterella parvirubra YIT 11816]